MTLVAAGAGGTRSDPSSQRTVLLLGTYDLGHQPFGLASPAAWLRAAGYEVEVLDLSRQDLDPAVVRRAEVVACHIPMHTATRLALDLVEPLRALNPKARLCFFGLYGQANADQLLGRGADAVLSGEYEAELVRYVEDVMGSAVPDGRRLTVINRLDFKVPDREGLPALDRYAQLAIGDERRVVAYTEATRGCRHMCRHCPVAPVYGGRVRVVGRDVVLSDIAAQVAAGAEHVTFGDPDFFNASAHAIRVVEGLHEAWPDLTYDVTVKVEHLLRHRRLLPRLAETGCLFVTSAVESIDDHVLEIFAKGHTRADFSAAVAACRAAGLQLNPTFVTFHPWLDRAALRATFEVLDALGLVESVAPVQLTTRLLVPEGSLLLELPDFAASLGPFDPIRLVYPWSHSDPELDALQVKFEAEVADAAREGRDRRQTFDRLWKLAGGNPPMRGRSDPSRVAQFLEPWFCCSEPVGELVTGWNTPDSSASLVDGGGDCGGA